MSQRLWGVATKDAETRPLDTERPFWPKREVKKVRGANSLERLEESAMHTSGFDPVVMRQARIGRSLREVYDCVTDSPLPDQFDALLAELDKIGKPSGSN